MLNIIIKTSHFGISYIPYYCRLFNYYGELLNNSGCYLSLATAIIDIWDWIHHAIF